MAPVSWVVLVAVIAGYVALGVWVVATVFPPHRQRRGPSPDRAGVRRDRRLS